MNLQDIIKKLENYEAIMLPQTFQSAGVLILLLYTMDNEISLVVTKRSSMVTRYIGGDYCFPGGLKEEGDKSLLATAKREVSEELGIHESCYHIIAQLDDFYDRHYKLVRPFVGILPREKFEAKLNEEIENIYFFPLINLSEMIEDKGLEKITRRRPAYKYINEHMIIWGLTASIMVHLYNLIFDDNYVIGKEVI